MLNESRIWRVAVNLGGVYVDSHMGYIRKIRSMEQQQLQEEDSCLLFEITGVLFSVSTEQVESIIEPPLITLVPMMPDYVQGSFSFRGHAASAVNTRQLLHLSSQSTAKRKAYIVTQHEHGMLAFEVDRVVGIVDKVRITHEQNLFSQAGLVVHVLESHGMAVHVSFSELLDKVDCFASPEWKDLLEKSGLMQEERDNAPDESSVVAESSGQEVLADPQVNAEALENPVNDETPVVSGLEASGELNVSQEQEYVLSPEPELEFAGVQETSMPSEAIEESYESSVEEEDVHCENRSETVVLENDNDAYFDNTNIGYSETPDQESTVELTQKEIVKPFREVPLASDTRHLFSPASPGWRTFAGLGVVLILSVALFYGWNMTDHRVEVSADVAHADKILPTLPPVGRTETVVKKAQNNKNSQRVVEFATPDFSITVDRPPGNTRPEARQKNLSINLGKPEENTPDGIHRTLIEKRHVVQTGDTLWAIAESFLENPYRYAELAENSGINDPNLIYPGDVVTISRFSDLSKN